jgi:hypothetical protein
MSAREVTLYVVEEMRVMAYDRASFVRRQRLPDLNTLLAGDVVLSTMERSFERVDAPVRRYNESMMLDDGSIAHRESFIAIDPKLEYMMTQPIMDKMEWVNKRCVAAMSQMELYQDRIREYNDLPWYKRIFRRV